MYLSGGHKTVKNILKRGAFTVSMGDAEHAAACDYVGIESGNSMPDKVARAGFHVTKSEHVDAPVIDELLLALECKLVSYDEETRFLTGEIVNVSVDERALDETASSLSKSCTSSPLTMPTTAIMSWARRSPARSRTAKNSSRSGETESAASRIFFGTRRFFAVSVRISTLFVQNRRISVRISLKTVPFTTGTGAGQMV